MQIDSPESVKAEGTAHVNINRFNIGDKTKDRMLVFILALSILVNVLCLMEIRNMGTEWRLFQYNLDWFKGHEFSDLKNDVEVQKRVFGLTCKKE